MEINDSANVDVFGIKGEGSLPIVTVRDSADVRLLGFGGNAAADGGQALFVVDHCRDCLLATLVEHPFLHEMGGWSEAPPTQWVMIRETGSPDKGVHGVPPLERPALYATGDPTGNSPAGP